MAGCAIHFSPSIILTYNKKHFILEKLEKEGVKVFTPRELIEFYNLKLETKKIVRKKGRLLRLVSGLLLRRKK